MAGKRPKLIEIAFVLIGRNSFSKNNQLYAAVLATALWRSICCNWPDFSKCVDLDFIGSYNRFL